ncbi:lectin-like domain-containing protein [Pontibacter chitinilyticus]|uniref:lectin-like domain-containing protein n=1 Tax=Pontibacter chitinilyticus TaxID=2674989 RepID=UPI00321B917E
MNIPLLLGCIFYFLDKKWASVVLCCIFTALAIPYVANAQFVTRGDAVKLSGQCFKITEDQQFRYGSIWSQNKIDLSKPVELEFIIYMGTKDADGADGIAFLFHNDPRGFNATGNTGHDLGFAGGGGIKPSVAVEFDTWQNQDDPADIPADHTAVSYNGDILHPVVAALQIDPGSADVENNQCHTYKISWDPVTKELKLFFDGQQRFSHTDDIVKNVFKGTTEVYYGFTGSTGGSSNEQTICVLHDSKLVANDDVVEAEPGKPIQIDVLANDTGGGDSLILTRIRHQVGKGVATIVGNKLLYTPDAWIADVDDVVTYEISDVGTDQCYAKTATANVRIKVRCKSLQAPVQITASGSTTFCAGESVTLSMPGGVAGPKYQWKRDGVAIGENRPELVATASGSYTLAVTTVCGTTTASPILVKAVPVPLAPVVPDVERCGPGEVSITATGAKAGEYRWYSAAVGGAPLPETGSRYTTPALTATATYYVSVLRNDCESPRVPVKAVINPVPDVAPYAEIIVEKGSSVTLQSTAGGAAYQWSPATGLSNTAIESPVAQPEQTTLYTVVVTTAAGCQTTGQTKVIVRKELVIPNAFSPNGDGVNETWEIATLEGYPDARVEIFDRWGSRIYEKTNYNNEWDGTSHGKALPVSTYFYVITLKEGRKLTGSVSIIH